MTKQLGSLIGVVLLLAAVSASAQNTNTIRVKVPFPFVTAGKIWPAAAYSVQIQPENGTVSLSSYGTTRATILTTLDERPGVGPTYLQFQRTGHRWFLHEVTLGGTGHVFPASELEKELIKESLSADAQPSIRP
jgi:hypothetical protein